VGKVNFCSVRFKCAGVTTTSGLLRVRMYVFIFIRILRVHDDILYACVHIYIASVTVKGPARARITSYNIRVSVTGLVFLSLVLKVNEYKNIFSKTPIRSRYGLG